MNNDFHIIDIVDDVSGYALANGCIYSIVDGRVRPAIKALNDSIEQLPHVNKFRLRLTGFGSVLSLGLGDGTSLVVDVDEDRMIYRTNKGDYKQPHQNVDIPDTSRVYTALYSKGGAVFPLGMRNFPLEEQANSELCTIERGHVSQLNDGKYLFSMDKGRNILNRIDARGLDVWQVQAEGQFESGRNEVLFRNAISTLIGVADNILWYCEFNGSIVGIDIESGVPLHRFNEPGSHSYKELTREENDSVYRIRDFRLSHDESKIIALQYMIYAELDLNDAVPQLEAYPLDAELKSGNIDLALFHKMSISGGQVLFHNGTTKSELIFGVFDTNSRSVVSVGSLNEHIKAEPIQSCMLFNGKYYVYFGPHVNSAGTLVVLEQRDRQT